MISFLRQSVCAGCFALLLLPLQATAMALFKPSCLTELAKRTQTWAECTKEFSRNDNRCKLPTGRMYSTMEQCAAKGHTPAEINAAMTAGYRKAGTQPINPPQAVPHPSN
ncbi:MAG: hypothetical protein IPJ33_10925 [Gammaproteobacteria bacterium]|jgi:7-keto-8-aminopelargonate synthetase-like enzyme|nr:hypothetical protein [Gammaproteobacteria bacterium]MBP6051022.1 hypothetical protein [Pseudomonadales bacterium]MBK6582529.1 hypothetical protein [Gammaproteobacteria bacterium]MBK7169674.1 hypothetical protein [Gammaproteobacteria bacterium]MBK7521204.1 hypothetical protein [Gammaproteobacteria bacterium]